MSRRAKLVVFLGPSLPAREARRLARCEVLPPARQGDLWRALAMRPKAIALVDGVFEATPSVWHHEVLTALASGVAVFGASSMGALRAAELHPYGMVGVGRIYADYRDGRRIDDADVALLHGPADAEFMPLTVPLVNVEYAADEARRAGVLSAAQARRLKQVARELFYQERTWSSLMKATGWKPALAAGIRTWLQKTRPDLKAKDARECLEAAWSFVQSNAPAPPSNLPRTAALGSSLVRRRRLFATGFDVEAAAKDQESTDQGLRRALLAQLARTRGLRATRDELDTARKAVARNAALRVLPGAELDAVLEDVILEHKLLANAQRIFPDGPSADEALAHELALNPPPRRR